MKKRIISLFLVLVMVVGITPLWSMADESTLITTITVSLPESQPQAGIAPYFPTILAVNDDTALTDRITFYAEWYESTDDLRHSPDQYTELSTEAFVLDMYYNLYVGITAKYGNELAPDCQLIAILPDGSTLESLMFDYDPDYLFAGYDFLFDKTQQEEAVRTNVYVENYALGKQGLDVFASLESDVFDFLAGSSLPYALYYPNGDEVGVSVQEDYLNPETPYWLGLVVTNISGDYTPYTKDDFTLNLPYTASYLVKNVEYMEVYFQLEPLAYQSVERLDFELDGYYGGAALDQVTLGLKQDGFWPYSEYNDHFGFHYDGVDEPGTYITPSEAATLVFDNSETLWLWVNVLPLYETTFTPPPEVSLNVPYTECLMKGCDDGSLDLAFQLAPLQKPNDLKISISGYEKESEIIDFAATVSGNGAEQSPGGYLDGYGIFADNNNEPGAILTQGTFAEETSYWAYVAMFPENGYDLSALTAEAFTFDGFTPESAVGVYDQDNGVYYLYFQLPQIQLNAVNEIVTFYLDGYELGGEINQIQVSHNSGQINMNDHYVAGYVILPEHEGKPDDLNFYQEGSFTADSTYWLGIAIQPAEGYSLRNARSEQFMLDGFDYSQVILDVVSSTEAYVYFKLPLAKVAHDIIFTFGGEDGFLFGYSVPDGTVLEEPAEPDQEGKVFLGWYTEENEKWDFTTPVTKDLVLIAKFEDQKPIDPDATYSIDVTLKGYTIGGRVEDASVKGTSNTVNIVTFADDKDFYILADKDGTPDYDSEVTEFEVDTQYWLMIGLETIGGGDLFTEDFLPSNFTYNGRPASFVFDDDVLMVIFKLKPLSETDVIYGDVDGNGKVEAADALEVLKSVVGKVTLTDDQSKAADVDGSGNVDAADALDILKKVVGKIEKFAVEL